MKTDIDEIGERVLKFKTLELPGQPMGMHMGTAYLISDLWRKLNDTKEALAGLHELCTNANEGAWSNGVTDSTGTIDEGDVRGGELIDRAYRVLNTPAKDIE